MTMLRTLRLGDDESGTAMIIAVTLSAVVATLAALMLTVGGHSDKASARGRHYVQALHVAESGIEQAIAKIDASGGSLASTTFSGQTEAGSYDVTITRGARNRYTVESVGGVRAGRQLGAERKLRVILEPPVVFEKALFSYTTVTTKNNDIIDGDVWANHNVILALGTRVTGSVSGATGYVELEGGAIVEGDVQSGGFNADTSYAIRLRANSQVHGNATASVVTVSCSGSDNSDYKVRLATGSIVGGNVTTWGPIVENLGTIQGTVYLNKCTQSPPTQDLPAFTFAASNYASVTYFGTPSTPSLTAVSDFQAYLSAVGNQLSGTIYINQADPVNQGTRVNLTNTVVTGDATIITNTPIFTNNTTDSGADAIFTLVSLYDPPTGTVCDVNDDISECSMHIKNNFSIQGTTAVALYAPFGPVAIKNNAEQFGAIYADSIEVKNNQTITYDSRVERVVGFGEVTYEITSWKELVA